MELGESFELILVMYRHCGSHDHLTEHTEDIILVVVTDSEVNIVASHHMFKGLKDHPQILHFVFVEVSSLQLALDLLVLKAVVYFEKLSDILGSLFKDDEAVDSPSVEP